MTAVVYRMRDQAGDLLYVGMTANPGIRLRTHAARKSWWSEVVSVHLEHFATDGAARRAEALAIKTEHPKFNVALTTRVSAARSASRLPRYRREWKSYNYELINDLVGGNAAERIADFRRAGLSWERVARELCGLAGINAVTGVTAREWAHELGIEPKVQVSA